MVLSPMTLTVLLTVVSTCSNLGWVVNIMWTLFLVLVFFVAFFELVIAHSYTLCHVDTD